MLFVLQTLAESSLHERREYFDWTLMKRHALMRAYTHTCTHPHTSTAQTFMPAYIHTHTCLVDNQYLCIYKHICTCTYLYIYLYIYVIYICIYIHIYIRVYMHVYIYVYINIHHICSHTLTHPRYRSWQEGLQNLHHHNQASDLQFHADPETCLCVNMVSNLFRYISSSQVYRTF